MILFTMIGAILLLLIVCLLVRARFGPRQRTEIRNMVNAANAPGAGRHDTGRKTYFADAAITRWSVVEIGTDENHIQMSNAATDTPIGIATDSATAAGDPVNVFLIPGGVGTTLAIATGVIAAGALVQSNGDGTVKTAVSTGFVIGRTLMASGATGDLIEIAPMYTGVALA